MNETVASNNQIDESKIILIVEDEQDTQLLLRTLLERQGYSIYTASDGYEALTLLEEIVPHLIICDILMPHMDGFTFRDYLVKDPDLELVPFIFLTALSDKKDKLKAFKLEADDYITKPFDTDDLILRIQAKLGKFSLYRTLITMDILTGLYNQRFLMTQLRREIERVNRYGRIFSIILIDIDHFKLINDTFGHTTGDMVLRAFAEQLQSNLRGSDFVGRYGGEEFIIVMPETNVANCLIAAERIRKRIAEATYTHEQIHLTISGGIASAPSDGTNVKTLLYNADRYLYKAKSEGRNKLIPTPHS